MRNAFTVIITTSVLATSVTSADSLPSFQGLGVLSGGNNSWAYGVSGDGTTVVGCSQSTPGPQAFRWTADEGMIGLGDLPGGGLYGSSAKRVSADGSVVVGSGHNNQYRAMRWTAEEGMVDLGSPGESRAYGVSADGSVVVGCANGPFRWTVEEGMLPLEGVSRGCARDVSADGMVVVGNRPHGSGNEAFLWTKANGPLGLGDLPGGAFFSVAYGISADGQVVVGYGETLKRAEAFRWTEADGMVGLGVLWDYQGYGTSYALDTNAAGSIVVGEGVIDVDGNTAAFLWDEQHGMRDLRDVLEDEYELDMNGWQLVKATGISDDGLTIVGYGDGPAGRREAWIARIPEPNSLLLMSVAIITFYPVRRCNRRWYSKVVEKNRTSRNRAGAGALTPVLIAEDSHVSKQQTV